MSKAQEVKKPKGTTYFALNNLVNIPKDGGIQLDKDKEAAKAYFLEHVNPNTVFFYNLKEKIGYLIEKDYIEEEFIKMYDFDFIKLLFKFLYNSKFRFKSFMGAFKFYNQYALKTKDGERYLERYEDRIAFMSLYLAQGDTDLAFDIATEHITQRLQMATPTFLNAGKKNSGEMVSCFLLDFHDSMLSIGRGINSALQLSKNGGGVGINLSNLREAGSAIKDIPNASSGVVPVMKILEDSFSYANQLGQRQGAGVTYLSVFHPDIYHFLSTKKENADEKIRVKTLSLGLTVPDKYYELLKTNEPMYLFSPKDVEDVYDKPFSYVNITQEYDNMVKNEEIKKYKTSARELEQEISKLQQESGYPYVINIDTANSENPVFGEVIMSNLCSEILQVQSPSKLNNDLSYDTVGYDISCNLASTNVLNLIKSYDFGYSVETAIKALNSVSNLTNIEEVPTVKKANDDYHSVGLGAMNLHGALAHYKIKYGTEESIEFTDLYFRALRYHALKASNNIAKELGEVFHEFEKSAYADGSYIYNKYIAKGDVEIKSAKNEEIFIYSNNIEIPTKEDWEKLNDDIMEHGLYNSYLLAVAPTGSISYINESTSSIHPVVQRVEHRQEGKVGAVFYPAPGLNDETIPYYDSAYDIDMRKVIDIYAAAQYHVDQGLSLTLFMRSELLEGLYEWKNGKSNKMTTRDLNKLRNYAWTKGIKSIYYVRTYTGDTNRDMRANDCESCVI